MCLWWWEVPIFFAGTSRLPSSQSFEFGEVCTWALGGGGPGHGGEEKVRLRVRVCEFAHLLSASQARGIEWGAAPRGVGQGRASAGSRGPRARARRFPRGPAPGPGLSRAEAPRHRPPGRGALGPASPLRRGERETPGPARLAGRATYEWLPP